MTISSLIDKQDSFEIVRDKIAQILAEETASQQALAFAAGKDPELWKLRIYTERSSAFEQFLNDPVDFSPLVNVWYDSSTFNKSSSDTIRRQKADGIYNIDCYGYGQSSSNNAGHLSGDEVAAKTAQRALRLVRNILMAAQYTYLDLRGLVWDRWPQSITVFQPQFDSAPVQNIVAGRVTFAVGFNEISPQVEPTILESVNVQIKRSLDGQVLAELEYDYT